MKRMILLSAALLGVALSSPAQRARPTSSPSAVCSSPRPVARYVARAARPRAVAPVAPRGPIVTRGVRGREVFDSRSFGRGHWELRCERVRLPGYWDTRAVPAVHGWVLDLCGARVWGVVAPARWQRVWVPARYESRQRRVWVRY